MDENKEEKKDNNNGQSGLQFIEISTEMKRSYLNYAMSVIVQRALPDVRDGLKPVHRRILYAMHKMGLHSGAKFSKSAKVVGEVLGKYHPHGDAPVYEALVRMAQTFSLRYPLIRGQGNFGSIDGDPAAAMRYTEVKLTKIAEEMLFDIEKETVPYVENFDASLKEPVYLPAKLPNLLLMGAEGIAVGMATKIPPHNLTEIIDAICYMIEKAKPDIKNQQSVLSTENEPKESAKELTTDNRQLNTDLVYEVTTDELLEFVKGPDFPTAGIMYGAADIQQVYTTGRGKILIRAKVDDEEREGGKMAIIVTELPYQVNKSTLVEKIAQLVVDKRIVGISDLRDESDRRGIRVVIELKRDASYKKVLNNLFKFTELQTSFPVNMVALVDGVPQTLSLKSILELYIRHRVEMVTKRSEYELAQAKYRAHILSGYLIALDHIDEVIEIIKKSKDEAEAKVKLMKKFALTDVQTQAILDMQLKRLTGLERSKIEEELKELQKIIKYLEELLGDITKILKVISQELQYLKEKYGDDRRTRLIKSRPGEITDEQLIENKEVIVVLTKEGYIKQVAKETFRVQHRGGKGVSGMETKDTDTVICIATAMTHDHILYFTNMGRVFKTRVWDIPVGTRISKGKAIVNVLSLRPDENVTSILTYPAEVPAKDTKNKNVLMVTRCGVVKKTPFEDFANIRTNGIIAINLDAQDELLWSRFTDDSMYAMLVSRRGKAIVFKEDEIRSTGRSSRGVKGMEIDREDAITAADVFTQNEFKKSLLVISERGIGKKTNLREFRGQHRGGKGVKVGTIDVKTGLITFVQIIHDDDETVVMTTNQGQVVKIPVKSIPARGRSAKGVILMRFGNTQGRVVSAAFI